MKKIVQNSRVKKLKALTVIQKKLKEEVNFTLNVATNKHEFLHVIENGHGRAIKTTLLPPQSLAIHSCMYSYAKIH